MSDISKLPKWAQTRILEAEAKAESNLTGANISHCHIENNAVKHDENSAQAITSIADALSKNAQALHELAKSVSGSHHDISFGNGIQLENVRAKD